MGSKRGPEIAHTKARVLAGDRGAVKPPYAAPPESTLHVWKGNGRIRRPRKSVGIWGGIVEENMRECGAIAGGHEAPTARYEFIGFCFNHAAKTVFLSEKTLQKLKSVTPLRKNLVGELKDPTSRTMCAAGVHISVIISF
ncbi:TcC31.12 [Trypanosoma grayi]|uniref:TcC31.12 n=1 Tax=Trypanosoma grayi TaxID=71804 RepID=UPI0004F48B81|nr:TcC31.12 [Trypanosoma grayi]KEG07071.1 TcC31.12 [Trypanosoma grayi]